MDYPESEDEGTSQQDEMATADSILDADDADMADGTGAAEDLNTRSDSAGPTAGAQQPRYEMDRARDSCHYGKRNAPGGSSSSSNNMVGENMPDLPPIYMTVRKEREKKMMTHHLSGGESSGAVGTSRGATVSQVEVIGSFANAGDKRHNHTMHRFDFQNLRNLSTSFNASNLMCTTCQEEHRVLRREIEGGDVGNDNPPVFILTDQNFPSMVPAGGEGNGTCMKIIQIEHGNLSELVSVFLEITKGSLSRRAPLFCCPRPVIWRCPAQLSMRLTLSAQMLR